MARVYSCRVVVILTLALLLTALLSWQMQTSPLLASTLTSPISPLSPLGWIPYVVVGR